MRNIAFFLLLIVFFTACSKEKYEVRPKLHPKSVTVYQTEIELRYWPYYDGTNDSYPNILFSFNDASNDTLITYTNEIKMNVRPDYPYIWTEDQFSYTFENPDMVMKFVIWDMYALNSVRSIEYSQVRLYDNNYETPESIEVKNWMFTATLHLDYNY